MFHGIGVRKIATKTEATEFSVERRAIVVEYLRGLFDVTAGAFQRLRDRVPLDVFLG